MTRGTPYQGQQPVTSPSATQLLGPEVRQGISCCPGAVRGIARVIRDPKRDTVEPGQILVAEQTDPGWILLFAGATGLLVERGSLLSHSAIVARELAIPMIVGVPDLTRWLKDGDHLEMDGATGSVRRLSTDPMSPSKSANPQYDPCGAGRAPVHEVLR